MSGDTGQPRFSPKFSIVIPTYNRAGLIFKTIDSVLAVDYDNFEIIVVDDGSTDETERLFSAYRHPKVTYLRKPNGERGAARNFGVGKASGDYVNFLDSDDLLLATHLRVASDCVERFARPAVFALAYRNEDSTGKILREISGFPDPVNDVLVSECVFNTSPIFVRRDVFDELRFDETRALSGSEDWLLWLRLAARHDFRFRAEITSALVDHDGRSVLHFKEASLVARSHLMLEKLAADPVFMSRYGGRLRHIRAYRYIYTGLHLALSGQTLRPLVYLAKAAATAPTSLFRRATLGTLKHACLNLFRTA